MTDSITNSSGRNLVNIGVGDLLSHALAFVSFVIIARRLGPDMFGLAAFGMSLASMLTPVVDFGLGFVGTREIARKHGATGIYLRRIVYLRSLLAVGCIVSLISLSALLIDDIPKREMAMLYSLAFVPWIINLSWAYQGVGRTEWFFIEKIVQSLLYLMLVLYFIRVPGDAFELPILHSLSAIIPSGVILIVFFRTYRIVTDPEHRISTTELLRSSFPLFVSTLLSSVSVPLGIALVVALSSLQESGFISAASRVVYVSAIVPNMLWSSFYPELSRDAATHRGEVSPRLNALFSFSVAYGMLPFVLGALYAEELVALILGESFAGSAMVFRMLCFVAGLQAFSMAITRVMPAFGKERDFRRSMVFAIGAQVVSSVILIPAYGALGAAAAFFLAESIVCSFAIRFLAVFGKSLDLKPLFSSMLAILFSVGMTELTRFALGLSIPVSIVCGIIVYALLLVRFSVLPGLLELFSKAQA